MTGKEFSKQARKLGAKVAKIDSAYWGKIWYETVFAGLTFTIKFNYEEGQPIEYVDVAGKYNVKTSEMEEGIRQYQAVMNFIQEVNQQ